MPFLDFIEKSYGEEERVRVIAFDSQGSPKGCYCVTKPSIDQFEPTSRGGVVIKWATGRTVHSQLQDKLRLLRLFKEGNVVMPYSCLYRDLPDGRLDIFGIMRSYPIWNRTPLILELSELEEARSFVNAHSLPLSEAYLQLAFEGFELSYEVQDSRLAFLSLMISMEAALGPQGNTEITHQVSRNAAVLLGSDTCESGHIFRDMKRLYSIRSKIVHGEATPSHRDQLRWEDLLRLRHYVRTSIKLLGAAAKPKKDVLARLNECPFGAHPFTPLRLPPAYIG